MNDSPLTLISIYDFHWFDTFLCENKCKSSEDSTELYIKLRLESGWLSWGPSCTKRGRDAGQQNDKSQVLVRDRWTEKEREWVQGYCHEFHKNSKSGSRLVGVETIKGWEDRDLVKADKRFCLTERNS